MTNRIKGFDGLRGIAVMLVIISHSVLWPFIGVENPTIKSLFSAHVGVSIFFVLSGYLITLLLVKEKESTGKIDIVAFIKRRSLRIFPLYYLAILFLIFMDKIGKASIPDCSYLYALTYTVNFIPKSCDHATISHFWSLSVEEHFYLIWPLVFMLGKRLALIIAAVLIISCIKIGDSIFTGLADWYPNRWTFPAMLPILIGCAAAIIHNVKFIQNNFSDRNTSNIILVAILAGLTSQAYIKTDVIWLASMASLLLYVYYRQDSTLVNILEFKPLVLIGVISYGLYVWQGVFTGNGPYRSGAAFPPPLYTGLWLTFIVAPISYIFFERPILKLKSRMVKAGNRKTHIIEEKTSRETTA